MEASALSIRRSRDHDMVRLACFKDDNFAKMGAAWSIRILRTGLRLSVWFGRYTLQFLRLEVFHQSISIS